MTEIPIFNVCWNGCPFIGLAGLVNAGFIAVFRIIIFNVCACFCSDNQESPVIYFYNHGTKEEEVCKQTLMFHHLKTEASNYSVHMINSVKPERASKCIYNLYESN